jgi:putative spermidine/putrescine transport system substrate-binding protein
MIQTRWKRWLGLSLVAGLLVSACGAPSTSSGPGASAAPGSSTGGNAAGPVTINILDVAGNLQLTQGMIDNFKAANPTIVADITFTKGTAPEMAGKLQAQQGATGEGQINLVLTGTDGLSAGIGQDVLTKILPDHEAIFPNLTANYLEPAAAMQELAQGYGIAIVYYPSGPLIEYDPAKVSNPPTTPDELLAWAKEHPGKFEYARPANSGPGRTFLMALPYLLGDKDPLDPTAGWEKTWAYLKELGKYITLYQTGTTKTMEDLGSGTVDIVASTTGWDINPRVLGTVPNTVKVGLLQPMNWVTDAQYVVIPKGVPEDVLNAGLALIAWMLKPDQQAIAYDKGYFYPGPAVKDVTLDMAPKDSQAVINEFGRPEYAEWIDQYPKHPSLPADQQVIAFDIWDREIGAR